MDLKLPKMLCKDSKQHHVMFHELNSVSSLLYVAQNVRFEIPYKDLYFETPFLMIFKYYAWASYGNSRIDRILHFYHVFVLFASYEDISLVAEFFSRKVEQ